MTIPFFAPSLASYGQVVAQIIEQGHVGPGVYNARLRNELRDLTNAWGCYLTTSGTKALELAFKAADLPFGAEVIVPVYGFVATAMAVLLSGLRPRFVDVNHWGRMSAENIEDAIGVNTAAVCFVNFNGAMDGIFEVKEICDKHHLVLVEDAAASIGHSLSGKSGGAVGDIGIYSFAPNKLVTCGQGGAVICSKPGQLDFLSSYCNQGDPERHGYSSTVGGNYRMADINAALGVQQLSVLRDLVTARQHQEWLLEWCGVPILRAASGPTLYNLIRTKDAEQVKRQCKLAGIDARTQFCPLHLQAPFREFVRPTDKFPNAMRIFQEFLYLPFGLGIMDEELEEIAGVLQGQPVLV